MQSTHHLHETEWVLWAVMHTSFHASCFDHVLQLLTSLEGPHHGSRPFFA